MKKMIAISLVMVSFIFLNTSSPLASITNGKQNIEYEVYEEKCDCGILLLAHNQHVESVEKYSEENNNEQSRALDCPCGGITIVKVIFQSEQKTGYATSCTHGIPGYRDVEYSQALVKRYTCNSCGFQRDIASNSTFFRCEK